MTRLRSLIKEVLSQPKKKDCNCGCNDCGGKAPILTEGKVKHLISEGLQYHIDKKIQLHESVYRIGSEKHFELIREARALWVRGIIDVSEDDQAILETHLGNFGMYEGEAVPLDMPMVNEEKYYITRNLGRGQGMSLVKDKEFKSYEDAKEEADRLERSSKNMTAYFVSDKDMKRLKEDYDPDAEQDDEDVPNPVDDEGRPLGESLNEGNIDKIAGGIPYKVEGSKAIISMFLPDDVKERIIKRAEENGYSAQPNMSGGITINLKTSLEEKKKAKPKKKDPPIGKPKRGGPKAYYVYVRDPKTKRIKKVTFGSGGLRAKIRNPKARNAFAKRHRCSEKNDRTKASYWSCRLPRYAKQLGLGSNMNTFW